MPVFRIRRKKGKILPDRFKRALHRRTVELLRGAVQAFLIEASRHIKIDTGMSLGSLMPIGRFVGVAFPIVSGRRSRRGAMIGWNRAVWTPNVTKEPSLGESLSQQGNNWDVDFGSSSRFVFKFRFEAVVFQHILNDLGLGGQAAWNSITRGRDAFLRYMQENRNEITPRFQEYLTYA